MDETIGLKASFSSLGDFLEISPSCAISVFPAGTPGGSDRET
jgi:hypothetical protein